MRNVLLVLPALLLSLPAFFQAEYPERPVRLIVSYPPGGGTDVHPGVPMPPKARGSP